MKGKNLIPQVEIFGISDQDKKKLDQATEGLSPEKRREVAKDQAYEDAEMSFKEMKQRAEEEKQAEEIKKKLLSGGRG